MYKWVYVFFFQCIFGGDADAGVVGIGADGAGDAKASAVAAAAVAVAISERTILLKSHRIILVLYSAYTQNSFSHRITYLERYKVFILFPQLILFVVLT